MNLNFLQSILMGIVSGLAEMLPVSAEAHRTLLRTFFGTGPEDAVSSLLIHMACLIAINWHYRNEIMDLRRTNYLMKIPPRRRKRPVDMSAANTVRLLRSATATMVVFRLFTLALSSLGNKLYLLSPVLIVNGLLLLIPGLVRSGNMDSRNMPRMNGLLMGLGGGMGVLPGISPLGAALSLGLWRGVDRSYALRFSYILLIPGLGMQILFDAVRIFTGGAAAFSGLGLLSALIGAIAAGIAAGWGIRIMNSLAQRSGFTGFAYYSWGTALLCFSLFLMI